MKWNERKGKRREKKRGKKGEERGKGKKRTNCPFDFFSFHFVPFLSVLFSFPTIIFPFLTFRPLPFCFVSSRFVSPDSLFQHGRVRKKKKEEEKGRRSRKKNEAEEGRKKRRKQKKKERRTGRGCVGRWVIFRAHPFKRRGRRVEAREYRFKI